MKSTQRKIDDQSSHKLTQHKCPMLLCVVLYVYVAVCTYYQLGVHLSVFENNLTTFPHYATPRVVVLVY